MSLAVASPNPTAIFGMLLAVERGATVDTLAGRVGLPAPQIAGILDQARNGDLGRASAYMGIQIQTGRSRKAGPVACDREEVLVRRWQRRVVRHLVSFSQIPASQVTSFLSDQEEPDCWAAMILLDRALARFNIKLTQSNTSGNGQTWSVDADSREALAFIVSSDWRVAVCK